MARRRPYGTRTPISCSPDPTPAARSTDARSSLFFKRALERADVRPVRIHDLRHTFATTVAASGQVSLRTLQERIGHLDARTTQIYAAYMPGEREQEQLDAAFRWPIGGQSGNETPLTTPEFPQNTG
ncbi:MAG: tyrosine-type recombinase/integrase [Solirubrobacterales bacterium]|nr:tyrosine-type recombinase/integrase [Solirubrobacterales bacterium]